MKKYKTRIFLYKLCMRVLTGEKIPDICNDLVNCGYLPKAMKYTGQKGYNSAHYLYNFYYRFLKIGIYAIVSHQGGYKNMPKKGLTKKELEEKRRKRHDELLRKLTPEELLEIVKIQEEILTTKISKKELYEEIQNKIKKKNSLSPRKICEALYISKSYFYKLSKNIISHDMRFRKDVIRVKKIISEEFKVNRGNFGARRIHAILKEKYQLNISYKTVYKYMNSMNLKSVIRAKNKRRIDRKNTNYSIENRLNRNFKNDTFNNVLCTDVTYIKWNSQFIYLSAAIDLRNNEIVGWSHSKRNDLELVKDTFKKINLSNYSLIHSDHGFQYSSNWFREMIAKNNLLQSMSRIGNSLDNRPIEYWFSILKEECLRKYQLNDLKYDQIIELITDFINYYNNIRIQIKLKNLSPCHYMRKV
ncbi:IS3 family transposase [Mycoplasma enhydrae]|uniref:IS3 family transposase n=1 Tax=Mycoplasma enhydrae TaxID=2499220 RepID=UPI00197BC3FA|nr:IS3 family transposase [Mycoplasma enhydrae]MBN4089750.1 IS3 family transposase [Mycoplasma enhydrae]MCV3733967.1 IS3 family transposase [Mycoplasma enhydrae]MCV3753761.1 IS3 family transposase [Mycoplasma enhydrae]